MRKRHVLPAVGLLLAVTLTACSSDGDAAKQSSSATSTTGATALAARLQAGVAKAASAHFDLTGKVGGSTLSGSGDQRIEDGKLTGLQAQATLPLGIGAVGLVIDGKERYVKAPPPLATVDRPWLRVSSDSSNLVVKQFAGVLDAALVAADPAGLATLAEQATKTRRIGSEPVGGTPATRYLVTLQVAKLPGGLGSGATGSIPIDLWLDGRDRPLRVHATLPLLGQQVEATVTFSDYDKPVTITPPPASQVAR